MRQIRAPASAVMAAWGMMAAFGLAGCGAGDPTYYRLAPVPGPTQAGLGTLSVEVHAPSVAPYLDRDYIVESVSDYRLHLAGNDAWAEPIGDMIGRTLVADLAQRLPRDTVRGDGAPGPTPDMRVDLDVSRFDRDGSGAALLHATLTLRGASGAAIRNQSLALAAPVTGTGTAAFAAAESGLLGQVADRAAAALAAVPPPAPLPPSPPSG